MELNGLPMTRTLATPIAEFVGHEGRKSNLVGCCGGFFGWNQMHYHQLVDPFYQKRQGHKQFWGQIGEKTSEVAF